MKKILAIDDCLAIHEIIAECFCDFYEVQFTTNISSSIQILSQETFDVIICDYELTDGTGEEIINYLRKSRVNIPTIVFSGMGDLNLTDGPPIIQLITDKSFQVLFETVQSVLEADRTLNK